VQSKSLILIIIILPLFLTGCVTLTNIETAQEQSNDLVGTITYQNSIGQTIISQRGGLNSFTFWAGPEKENESSSHDPIPLTFELYHSPQESNLLFTHQFYITTTGPIKITIPSQIGSDGQQYYILLKTTSGKVQVFGMNLDIYPGGEAWIDGKPVEADIAFRTTYDYALPAIFLDVVHLIPNLWLIVPLICAILLPGWVLIDCASLRDRFDTGEKIAVATGLSLSIIPVLMLWTTTLRLHWTRTAVWIATILLVIITIWRIIRRPIKIKISLSGFALVGVFILTLAVRLAMVRDYIAPAWVDSVHHALITRLTLINGSFPPTYTPYLNIPPTQYHAGFHSNLASFLWLSGLDIPEGMLLYGQVLNALTVFSVYLLTLRLLSVTQSSHNNPPGWFKAVGVIAALLTGLFSPMPAYYTSWGRYTQLAGVLLLPVVFTLIDLTTKYLKLIHNRFLNNSGKQLDASTNMFPQPMNGESLIHKEANNEGSDINLSPYLPIGIRLKQLQIGLFTLTTISCAGLLLIHYRVFAFLGCLIIPYVIYIYIKSLQLDRRSIINYTSRWILITLAFGMSTFLLTIPWMWPNLTRLLPAALEVKAPALVEPFSDFSWRFLTSALGLYVMIVAGLGLLWGIIRNKGLVFITLVWICGLFLLANLSTLHLPGGWLINNTSVEIILFIPFSISGGFFVGDVSQIIDNNLKGLWKRLYRVSISFLLVFISFIAAIKLVPILNSATILFRQDDYPAMEWINDNIPINDTILINPFNWGYGLYAGNDGGYWITPLTGRKTMPPPVLYGMGNIVDSEKIVTACKSVIEKSKDSDAFWELLKSLDIHFVYIGVRGGSISPELLLGSPHFRLLYNEQGVFIFKMQP